MSISTHIQRLWSFPGGLKLDGRKQLSNEGPIESAEIPRLLEISLSQHIGHPTEAVVKVCLLYTSPSPRDEQ